LQELPDPVLQPDEVLVKIHATSINPSDVKNVSGNMEHTTLPRTPGRDFAGVVVAGSAKLIGNEVWGTGGDIGFTRDGSHAEYIVLPKTAISSKPLSLSMEEAGSVGVTYVTAWLSLVDAAQVAPGETVLVIGATGGVGSAGVQIAKWKGARVLGTIRRESDRSLAQQAGVDVVINLGEQDIEEAIFAATEGKGVNVILDTVGGDMVETCLKVISVKGRLLEITASPKNSRVSFDMREFYHRQARLFGVDSRAWDVSACASILEALRPGFESKDLRLLTSSIETYSLQDGVKAYEQIYNHNAHGRVVLVP
jgi:NADPH:quinone reductase-like Zn-dependent oxidoreductase